MITAYIHKALHKAHYEMIDDGQPFYGEISELQGVWATGHTLEECRENLANVLEGWILIRVSCQFTIPKIDGIGLEMPSEMSLA